MSEKLKKQGYTQQQIDKMLEITEGEVYTRSIFKKIRSWLFYLLPATLFLVSLLTNKQGFLNLGIGVMVLNVFVYFFEALNSLYSDYELKKGVQLTKKGLLKAINPSKIDVKVSLFERVILSIFGFFPIIYLIYLGYIGTFLMLTVLVIAAFGGFAFLTKEYTNDIQEALNIKLAEDSGRTTKIIN